MPLRDAPGPPPTPFLSSPPPLPLRALDLLGAPAREPRRACPPLLLLPCPRLRRARLGQERPDRPGGLRLSGREPGPPRGAGSRLRGGLAHLRPRCLAAHLGERVHEDLGPEDLGLL